MHKLLHWWHKHHCILHSLNWKDFETMWWSTRNFHNYYQHTNASPHNFLCYILHTPKKSKISWSVLNPPRNPIRFSAQLNQRFSIIKISASGAPKFYGFLIQIKRVFSVWGVRFAPKTVITCSAVPTPTPESIRWKRHR